VTFGTLAKTAGASPTWDSTTSKCSNVYCHGATLSSGNNKTPQWTKVDGTQDACGTTCHANPPTGSWSGFPEGTFSHQKGSMGTAYPCGTCHQDAATSGSPAITDPTLHINGKADINSTASGCTCH
jgi:predicted CxxxxCH...CXXCH cytochrome family protein